MRRAKWGAGALALAGTAAIAGGVDKTGQSIQQIFEPGRYVELSYTLLSPNVSGRATSGGASSGDMLLDYRALDGAIKTDLSERLSAALVIDHPYAANTRYPDGTGYFAAGTTAELSAAAVTGILRYRTASNFSVIGGLRYQTLQAEASIPFVAGYEVDTEADPSLGYLVGVAFEKPEMAMRVSLTYNSEVKHRLATTEGALRSVTDITTPQSLNLEAQSGISASTMLFGALRWVDWSSFVIDPANYGPTEPLVFYNSDTVSYSLGLGHKFNDTWSGAATLGYEAPVGGFTQNLGPVDGYASFGLAAIYSVDKVKLTVGIRYIDIGHARTTLDSLSTASRFQGNDAVAMGVKVGYSF